MEGEESNHLKFKFLISGKSVRTTRFSVNWGGIIAIIAATRSQSSWRQDMKRRRLQIWSKSTYQHASCQPATRFPSQFRRSMFNFKVIFCPQVSRQKKKSPVNSALPTSLFACSNEWKRGGNCSGKKLTITWWCHVSKQPEDSATPYHSRVSLIHTEVTFLPEDAFVLVAPMLQDITELPLFQRLQLRVRPPC